MRVNTQNTAPLNIHNNNIEEVTEFSYLLTVIILNEGTEQNVEEIIRKAKQASGLLYKVLRSSNIILFNSNVTSVLLYGCETWKMTRSISTKL